MGCRLEGGGGEVCGRLKMEGPATYAIVILIQDADFIVAIDGGGCCRSSRLRCVSS